MRTRQNYGATSRNHVTSRQDLLDRSAGIRTMLCSDAESRTTLCCRVRSFNRVGIAPRVSAWITAARGVMPTRLNDVTPTSASHRNQSRRVMVRGVAIAALLALFGSALAQTGTPATGPTLVELQTRLKRAQSDVELEPMSKQKVIALYQAAIERIEIADEETAKSKMFLQRMETVADELRQTKVRLASQPDQTTLTVAEASAAAGDDLDKLDRMLEERRKQLDDPEKGLRVKVAAVEKELGSRMSRLEEIAKELAEVDERLATIQEELDAPVPNAELRELTHARQTLLLTRRMRAIEERAALHAEQAWHESDDAADLLRAQRELAAKEFALADAEAQLVQEAVDQRRGGEADQRVRRAELAITNSSPLVKSVAETNLVLATESRDVATTLGETSHRIDQTTEDLATLQAEFKRTKEMVEAVGLTESIGLLLRQQRAKLSDTRGLHARLAQRGETVRQTRMRLFQIVADIASLRELDAAASKAANELTSGETAAAGARPATAQAVRILADEVKPLLEQRRELLERLNDDYEMQFKRLVALDNDERKLLDATRQYADYTDERVLWIRTGTVFGGTHGARAVTSLAWLVDPVNWLKVVDALRSDFQREPLPYWMAFAALLIWAGLRWTMRSRLRTLGMTAASASCHELRPTLQAMALTLLLAAMVPALLAFFGWRLDHSVSTSKFVHAVASGLLRAATFAVPLQLLRWIASRGGLAEQHFDWSPIALVRLRRHLRWFLPAGIILIGFVGLVEATSDEQRLDSLGRLGYLAFAGLLAIFCQRAFPREPRFGDGTNQAYGTEKSHTSHPVRRAEDSKDETDVWLDRLSRVGRFLGVTVPLGLLMLAWSGYFYTALQLTWRLHASAWLVMALLLLRAGVLRWITLERRRMAVLQAEELQAIAEAGKHPETGAHTPFLFPQWRWPDFRLNLTQIVTQIRSLLDVGLLTIAAVGLWFVWADVTPALNILDRVPLWQTTVEEVVETKGIDDKSVVQVVTRPKAVTAANLGLALLMMAIAMVAGRNIPGLVEVILLEHLSVDAGFRFATTCLVRYAIFIAGVCLAFAQIGIGWNSVQWLVAAASVGLGFGLQEIFANFVSGIILLFERPMRVGDVITIGDTTGTVSRIRFRATTIIDGDRKELIVPNKSFITGNLLNWTLSDSVNRLAIKIHVGPGNDPQQVRELLLKLANEHPLLLKEPAPSAALEEIGANGLLFVLRAFLPTLKDRPKASNDLYTLIHARFRDAGIEMPCPTQEVLVRMLNPESQPDPRTAELRTFSRT